MKRSLWILTLFPDYFSPLFQSGVIPRSLNFFDLHIVNIRDYALNRYKSVDDTPFGGAPGMIMRADILQRAFEEGVLKAGNYPLEKSEWSTKLLTCFTSPRGRPWNQEEARLLKQETETRDLLILCGRYEGVDERFLSHYIEREYSLGDFVLSGGEIAAMAILDSCLRLHKGVLGNEEGLLEESFEEDLLEGPQYTRPREFEGEAVPEIYLSGHHKMMTQFRQKERLRITQIYRPDLYNRYLSRKEKK